MSNRLFHQTLAQASGNPHVRAAEVERALDIVRRCAEKGGRSGKHDDLEKDRERMRDCLAKVKDYHDTGRSGWWLLIGVIPLLGAIALIVFFAQDGEPGTNRFGSNPKEGSTGHTVAAAADGKSWAASTGKR